MKDVLRIPHARTAGSFGRRYSSLVTLDFRARANPLRALKPLHRGSKKSSTPAALIPPSAMAGVHTNFVPVCSQHDRVASLASLPSRPDRKAPFQSQDNATHVSNAELEEEFILQCQKRQAEEHAPANTSLKKQRKAPKPGLYPVGFSSFVMKAPQVCFCVCCARARIKGLSSIFHLVLYVTRFV